MSIATRNRQVLVPVLFMAGYLLVGFLLAVAMP